MTALSSYHIDVVLVVLDCARASDFPGGAQQITDAPFLQELQSECVTFPRSVASSSWTVPTHASILTGLYPIDHRSNSMMYGSLPSQVKTLPERLGEAGYETAMFAANHNLRPSLGLTKGFKTAYWGRLGVNSIRLGESHDSPFTSGDSSRTDLLREHTVEAEPHGIWKVVQFLTHQLPRFPFALDVASRIFQRVMDASRPLDFRVAPWVESAFSEWVTKTPASMPIFAMINFMDCHEPYLPAPSLVLDRRDYIKKTRPRQDVVQWAKGEWAPSREQVQLLHELYREALTGLDARISSLVDTLKATGRWDKTLFIITSDHGQEFTEDRLLFHGVSIDEDSIRVPLWVRFPGESIRGRQSTAWTSSVDLLPTIAMEAGIELPAHLPGVGLRELVTGERKNPVFSFAEGMVAVPSPGRQSPRRVQDSLTAGYFRNKKVEYSRRGQYFRVLNFTDDGFLSEVPPALDDQDYLEIKINMINLGVRDSNHEAADNCLSEKPIEPVDRRLAVWGYE